MVLGLIKRNSKMVQVITKIQATGTTLEKKHDEAQHFDLSHFDITKERPSKTGLDLQVVDQTSTFNILKNEKLTVVADTETFKTLVM